MSGSPILPFDESLVCREVPAGSWFVDNDVLSGESKAMDRLSSTGPLISAITYCEAVNQKADANARAVVEAKLRQYHVRVVPFDEPDASHFAALLAEAVDVLRLAKERRQDAKRRLKEARNDLMLTATAVRHGCRVITRNTKDFRLLPSEAWIDVTTYLAPGAS